MADMGLLNSFEDEWTKNLGARNGKAKNLDGCNEGDFI
jgi:hypothetical protein